MLQSIAQLEKNPTIKMEIRRAGKKNFWSTLPESLKQFETFGS
jgi:hypothetical protein